MRYLGILEEELKNRISEAFFSQFDCSRILGKIDFCVAPKVNKKKTGERENSLWLESYLWAEAKKAEADIGKSLVQLILTIGKARTFDQYLPPKYLGAFNACKIAFVSYYDIQDIFYINDFNWKVTPSNYNSKEFEQIYSKVKEIWGRESSTFDFDTDRKELQHFIKNNFLDSAQGTSKVQIDKNNFIVVYSKWLKEVKPSIVVDWQQLKSEGIIDGDFYLADLLSKDNQGIQEKLFVLLQSDAYQLDRHTETSGLFKSSTARFKDKQAAHRSFWNRYQRPPQKEYWSYIINRRDLLVPQDIREGKGSFFTPQIWVERAQSYIAKVLGEDWQDEYTVWDCAAGTGNLLHGLTNKYNIYASTVDQQDVDVMHQRVTNGANLLDEHVFRFDFLNDNFNKLPESDDSDKLPESLQNIVNDPEKRKKLLIFINPPYAEATSTKTITGTGSNKEGVSTKASKYHQEFQQKIGAAANELFALFMCRVYKELPGCHLALFSKLKFVSGNNFRDFKQWFQASFRKGFVVPANTFDNVQGSFPIGFSIWDLSKQEAIKTITCSAYDKEGEAIGQKNFYGNLPQSMNQWIKKYRDKRIVVPDADLLGLLVSSPSDIQHKSQLAILSKKQARYCWLITKQNILMYMLYFSVRHCIEATWLNDRDQFLLPQDTWKNDIEFHNNCLAFALFHGQNRISSEQRVNHWIPFTEPEVAAQEKFASNFMSDYIAGKCKIEATKQPQPDIFPDKQHKPPSEALVFSQETKQVFAAGLALWKYYHKQNNVHVNASYYDIRGHFQGFNSEWRMNHSSNDAEYNKCLSSLKRAMAELRVAIQEKVYEHGFLKE